MIVFLLQIAFADDVYAEAAPVVPIVTAETSVDYLVGVGDVLAIEVLGEPELSGSFPVETNGRINFPIVGEVPTAASSGARGGGEPEGQQQRARRPHRARASERSGASRVGRRLPYRRVTSAPIRPVRA